MASFMSKFGEVIGSSVKGMFAGAALGVIGGALVGAAMTLLTGGALNPVTGALMWGKVASAAGGAAIATGWLGSNAGAALGGLIGIVNVAKAKEGPSHTEEIKQAMAQGVAVGHAIEAQEHARHNTHFQDLVGRKSPSANFQEALKQERLQQAQQQKHV